jgi:hypothetical protein
MTRYSGAVAAAVALGVAAVAGSQARDGARPGNGTASIAGVVFVAGAAKQPARRVRVTLTDATGAIPGQTSTTDDSGAFVFRGIRPGRFELQAFKNGYLRSSYGALRPDRPGTAIVVKEGDGLTNLTMTIARGGVITGVVVDARGRPLPGLAVRVSKLGYDAVTGEPTLTVPATSVVGPTDDRGEYRAFGLPPGGYLVMVNPSTGGRSLGPGDDIRRLATEDVQRALQGAPAGAPPGASITFAPVFHPGVSDVSAAATIALGVSEERAGVDVVVQPVSTASVSGQITAASGDLPSPLSLRLVPAGPRASLLAAAGLRLPFAQLHADGTYQIAGVAPGTYTVTATTARGRGAVPGAASVSATADIVVSGQDLDVPLTLQPDVPVHGRVVFDGALPPPADLQRLSFALVPLASGGVPPGGGGRVDAGGRFAFAGVAPGMYRFVDTWNSPGAGDKWAIASSMANGRDVLDSPLRVSPNEPIEWVIGYSSRPSVVRGIFADRGGRPATDYTILLFPVDRGYWTPGSRRVRLTRPATDGNFRVVGLPAGDYFMAALADLEPGEWNDPAMLATLVQWSLTLTVRDGQTTTQDLRVGG